MGVCACADEKAAIQKLKIRTIKFQTLLVYFNH